jgi:hypothetical protein
VLQQPNGSTQQQQQPYAAPTVYSGAAATGFGPAGGPVGQQAQQTTFVHPGTLMGPAEVQLLRQRASGTVAVDTTWHQVCSKPSAPSVGVCCTLDLPGATAHDALRVCRWGCSAACTWNVCCQYGGLVIFMTAPGHADGSC